jgi:hypothetical protein
MYVDVILQSSICIPQAIIPLTQSQVTAAPVTLFAAGTIWIAIAAVAASTVLVTAHIRYTQGNAATGSIPDEVQIDLVPTTQLSRSKFARPDDIPAPNRNCTKLNQAAFT